MSRYLFTGDRHWDDPYIVSVMINGLAYWAYESQEKVTVIEGEAKGLDTIAGNLARVRPHLIEVESYPAEWDKYGRAAGPRRNRQMLKEGKPKVVFAFHDDIENSKGTKDMVTAALNKDLPVYLIQHLVKDE